MQKNELRKVIYEVWDRTGVDKHGYFHKFGDIYEDDVQGIITLAIIENAETGNVEFASPINVRFVESWT
ncbi:MAG: hypothetical protein EOO20_22160 [Chryseobacterium sp.]|nr:MAG: hypothetical protein EOO20_22160 [Chryseobacterium sp.]